MKKLFTTAFVLLLATAVFSQTSKITGKWKTIDDKDGKVKSIVEIYKATNGKYYGKIEKLFDNPNKVCTECEGNNKNQPIQGLIIINGMSEKDGKLTGGTILDPKSGKIYYCTISFDEKENKLVVRGSLDKRGFLGRSQTWLPAK